MVFALTTRAQTLARRGLRHGHVRARRAARAHASSLLLRPPSSVSPPRLVPRIRPARPQNYPSFEHHADWAKNKWKPAAFVFGFASIGLIVPAFGISFAQWKAKRG